MNNNAADIQNEGFRLSKLNKICRDIKLQNAIKVGLIPVVSATIATGSVQAAQSIALEEVVVTARKRVENLQDIPMSIQAIDSKALSELNISSFDDYAMMLPNLSYNSTGPNQAQLYMRGISDGGDGNFSGSNPSVAIYLDEQPVTVIGRNMDVHIYDIQQVEVLAGPQGTLFGASSQAGTLRIITNKPQPGQFEAGFDLGLSDTEEGEMSHVAEGFVNIPISDNAAIRLVAWQEHEGGYIDAVASGDKTFSFSGVTINNDGFVEDDFNEVDNMGLRAAAKVDLTDEWALTFTNLYQKTENEGVWDHDPEDVGELEVIRFNTDEGEDEFNQFSFTLEGSFEDYEFVYAGSWLDRDISNQSDYTEYAEYSAYIEPYYTCAYDYVSYSYDCNDPRIQFAEDSEYKRLTQEVRLQYQGDGPLSYIVGAFYEDAEHEYVNQYYIDGIQPGVAVGNNPNSPNAANYGALPTLYFVTDQKRTEEQISLFGELTYDINDSLTATVGMRSFDNESSIEGFVGTVYSGSPDIDVSSEDDGETYKVNLTYNIDHDKMVYFTYSEGYRSGGVNREQTSNIPLKYKPDLIENYEFGWKTTLIDGRMRFNGAIYRMDWSDIQFTRFDPSESLLGLTSNAGQAEVQGLEIDIQYQITEMWDISFNGAYNSAELAEDYVRSADGSQTVPDGTELPFVPDLKYNVTTRYNFNVMGMDAYSQLVYAFTGESYNDLVVSSRSKQAEYDVTNFSLGVEQNNWTGELFVSNLTDERAELYRNATDIDERITTNRPRTIGLRLGMRFD